MSFLKIFLVRYNLEQELRLLERAADGLSGTFETAPTMSMNLTVKVMAG